MSDIFPEQTLEAPPASPEEAEAANTELASTLWGIVREYERQDESTRNSHVIQAKKGEHFWAGRQRIYWNASLNDWITLAQEELSGEVQDYIFNIYRPNGESIIAAMSASLPQVTFYPDDADNPDDIATAQAYAKISELIQKHNKSQAILTKALYILYNQHFAAAYNYSKKSHEFGSYQVPQMGPITRTITKEVCPNCGAEDSTSPCFSCGSEFLQPNTVEVKETFEAVVGYSSEPKAREIIEVFGPLNVKIAPYVQKQQDSPYLIFEFEAPPAYIRSQYPHISVEDSGSGSESEYERSARSEVYQGDATDLVTVKCVWLRPWAFLSLDKNDPILPLLQQKYDKGVYAVFVNGKLAEAREENLDDHWTVTHSPLSTYIHADPIGKAGIPVQEARNELVNLTMETMKYGIPQTFADSSVLDFNQYQNSEVAPGMVYPVKGEMGKSVNDAFHTVRTATLSQEIKEIKQGLDQDSQLTTGAFPSIYGGIMQGSRTASEYAQSRAQALQRLSITWSMIKHWWAEVLAKCVVSYANNMAQDERMVQKNGGSFINAWIRRSDLTGKIGSVEPEVDEQLPTSWAQKREVLMQLIQYNSPEINSVLYDPDNATQIKGALGFKELQIPGEQDRLKQLREIQLLKDSGPMPLDGINMMPSVEIEEIDDDEVHSQVCKSYLLSEVGQQLKLENPAAYQNILLHFQMHEQRNMMRMMQNVGGLGSPEQREPGDNNSGTLRGNTNRGNGGGSF